MGYLHIDNLYKNTEILLFKECYALEKVHGTSVHISWKGGKLILFSGGEKHSNFIKLFDIEKLESKFKELFEEDVTIFGEAYGGKQQGMSDTYGKELKFIVFDVKVGKSWLNVPNAEDVAKKFNLEFVPYVRTTTELKWLDFHRDYHSIVAERRGIKDSIEKKREGIVLRPLIELNKNNGERIIVKHKSDAFRETKSKRIVDPDKLKVLEEANSIAKEWVTPMRLNHVLDKLGNPKSIQETGNIIKAMIEDVYREAKGEIIESRDVKTAIGRKTAKIYKLLISKIKI